MPPDGEKKEPLMKKIRNNVNKAKEMKLEYIKRLIGNLKNKLWNLCNKFWNWINIFRDYEPTNKEISKEKLIIKFGKIRPGYCESWIIILVCVALIFLGLLYLSYFHATSI